MNTDFIRGIIPPIVTPVDENEKIDEAKLTRQVNFIIEGGCHGILVFGSNSEFYMPEDDELERGLKIALKAAGGRVPIYFGVGAIRTRKCVKLAQMALANGATAVSVLTPMFLRPTPRELYEHFRTIANSVGKSPMLLYSNPGRVGYGIPVDLVTKLVRDCENIVGIKDSSGDMTVTAELIRNFRGTNFKVLGGKDTLIYGTMAHGGHGAIATTANFWPELVCSIYEKYVSGDREGSLEAQYRLNPLRLAMDKASFPVATKDLANLRGLDVGEPYRPSLSSDSDVKEALKNAARAAGMP
ncbi:MAG: dihydrodipicolinate synthase family protein [Synergistaceae bacterium]|jgi:4-hydroxy-tetrahydrodipicolinate synthase|nr:dihydrodipicolinate synthase family protein [Synergistaceae bacterium]